MFALVLHLVFCLVIFSNAEKTSKNLPEETLNTTGIIEYWGYPAEEHSTITDDGYILSLQRIPHGRQDSVGTRRTKKNRPVVFLQHGLLCSSSNWVTNLPSQSLAFILADAGYDVWLGNARGNTYSRKHVTLTTNDEKFWAFSWDEIAKYDLPAMVDYALFISGQRQLYYVGHSQGTLMAFTELPRNPVLTSKIKVLFALAPVAKVTNIKSPLRYASYFTPTMEMLKYVLGSNEFLPNSFFQKWLAVHGCPKSEGTCGNVLFLICGYDTSNFNSSRIPIYYAHVPAGTSVQNIIHYGQMMLDNKFQAYDYGITNNILKYGTPQPTEYSLKNLTTPVYAFSGGQDWLADPVDVAWLVKRIPHLMKHKYIEKYNHLDFIWGEDAHHKIYKQIKRTIKKYHKGKHLYPLVRRQ